MKKILLQLCLLLCITAYSQQKVTCESSYGGLQMPVTYSDHMVLQREKPLLISGTADAGQQIAVRIAGQKKEAETAPDGKWSLTLDPLQAGGPYELTVEAWKGAAVQRLIYKDVLVGEVWLCSGQSNMAFQVNELMDSQRTALLQYADKQSQIRLFNRQPRWYTNAMEWDISVMDSLNRLQYYHDTQWRRCDRQTAGNFSAVAFAFGRMLSDSLQVPVGLILNAVGGAGTEAWIDRKTLDAKFTDIRYNWTENDLIQDWVRNRAALNIRNSPNKPQRHPYEPCYLYEAGIQPLQQYPIKGVIWYQGESNAQDIETHERLFSLLVESWRENWQEELPFYYVQLSSLDRPSWPQFRNSQRKMMEIVPNTGMAVSSDRGDSLDVHPKYKREIGERLARWALNKTYKRPIIPSGPLFRSVEFKNAVAYVSFDYAEGLHTSDGQPIRTFEIAAHDERFLPAQAEIAGDTVKVWNEQITTPRLIRYGWQPFTRANLVNAEELPASTFNSKSDNNMIHWSKLPDLPGMADTASLGVSAPFTGISNGMLLVAGGCNFPDKPVTEGGVKKYYNDIFVLDLSDQAAGWKKAGSLPFPVAYGASATTPFGVICIGGNNSESTLSSVSLLSWNKAGKTVEITPLASLPAPMDNLSATYSNGTVYIAGGNEQAIPRNRLLSLQMDGTGRNNWNILPDFPGPARVQPTLSAQQSAEGMRIYLAGGFQPAQKETEAIMPTDMLSFHLATKTWKTETELPACEDGTYRSFTGGCSVSYGDSSVLWMGGVNYDRFLDAVNRPIRIEEAESKGDKAQAESLRMAGNAYMYHPAEWYKFNTALLQYNTFTKAWFNLGEYEQLARAGAGIVLTGNQLIIINGETKPGIRTSQVNLAEIQ